MAVNKVVYGNTTLVDLTNDTVAANHLRSGYTAHDKSGQLITGTLTQGEAGSVYQDENGYVVLDDEAGQSISAIPLTVTENGTYTAPSGNAYTPITVSVPGYSLYEICHHTFSGDLVLPDTVTRLFPYQFQRCTGLTSISAPNVKRFTDTGADTSGVGSYVFANCSNLTSISFPSLIAMGSGGYQFSACTKLTSVYMPKCNTGQYMFNGCTGLVKLAVYWDTSVAKNLGTNGNMARGCTKLQVVDCGYMSKLDGNYEFYGCSALNIVILRNASTVSLKYTNSFTNNTKYMSSGTGGTVYVKKSILANYRTATNWSTILGYTNNMLLPIEGSYYETHLGDDTEISGSSYSDPKYFLLAWNIYESDGVLMVAKNAALSLLIQLRGEYPLVRSNNTNTYIYPVEIPDGKTGVTIYSDFLDIRIHEMKLDSNQWVRTELTDWLLESDSNFHSYTFSDITTTHICVNFRSAGDTELTGTVTQAMLDAIAFEWNS